MGRVDRWVCLALLCGCQREETSGPPLQSQGPPQTSTPALDLSVPEYDCFAEISYDLGQDGTVEGTGFEGYAPAKPTWLMYAVRDENGNGLPDNIETYERDEDGNPLHYVREGRDPKTVDSIWDEQNNLRQETFDYESDGRVDHVYLYTWVAPGLMQSFEIDYGGDGEPDYGMYAEYDEDGLMVTYREDADLDGDADLLYTYSYDEQDRLIESVRDYENDGIPDRIERNTWTSALEGITEIDLDADTLPDGRSEFVYDEQGHVVSELTDDGMDGVIDWEFAASYDEQGRLLTIYNNDLSEYEYEQRESFVYDALGRTVEHSEYLIWDGMLIDLLTTNTFQGSCP